MIHANLIEDEETLAEIVRNTQVVAVAGMRSEEHSDLPAFLIPKRVQEAGIRVIPVNPKILEALSEKAYPDLKSVPDSFDMVNVFRRSEAIGPLAEEVLALPAAKRPKVVWLQTGIVNDPAALKLAQAGIKVVQDRCLAVYTSRYRR